MIKTLRISFQLKSTYMVNNMLHTARIFPLIGRFLPGEVYSSRWLKGFAYILALLWEIAWFFLGKYLYLQWFVLGPLERMGGGFPEFLHLMFFLTLIGGFANNDAFSPTQDKYYALSLMRMNPREYTLIHYGYSLLKSFFGFLAMGIWMKACPVWCSILVAAFVVGVKLTVMGISIHVQERGGTALEGNLLGNYVWYAVFGLLVLAYGLPILGIVLPPVVLLWAMGIFVLLGIMSVPGFFRFRLYRQVWHKNLSAFIQQQAKPKFGPREEALGMISEKVVASSQKGLGYLHDLFVQRHRKILWRSTKQLSILAGAAVGALLILLTAMPELRPAALELIKNRFPMLALILFSVNSGSNFTKALFMNCDQSLLTFSFFRRPGNLRKLFLIRLGELTLLNIPQAMILGTGLAGAIALCGGELFSVSAVCIFLIPVLLAQFFSALHLTAYYLFQPYHPCTGSRSGWYDVLIGAVSFLCFTTFKMEVDPLLYCLVAALLCAASSIGGCALVWRLGPARFRLRKD